LLNITIRVAASDIQSGDSRDNRESCYSGAQHGLTDGAPRAAAGGAVLADRGAGAEAGGDWSHAEGQGGCQPSVPGGAQEPG